MAQIDPYNPNRRSKAQKQSDAAKARQSGPSAQQRANLEAAARKQQSGKKKFYSGAPKNKTHSGISQTGRTKRSSIFTPTVLDTDYREKRKREIKEASRRAREENIQYQQPAPDVPEAYVNQQVGLSHIEANKYLRRGMQSDYIQRAINEEQAKIDRPLTQDEKNRIAQGQIRTKEYDSQGRAYAVKGGEEMRPTPTSVGPSLGVTTPSGLPTVKGDETTESPHYQDTRRAPVTTASLEKKEVLSRKFGGKKFIPTDAAKAKLDKLTKLRAKIDSQAKGDDGVIRGQAWVNIDGKDVNYNTAKKDIERQIERIQNDIRTGGSYSQVNPEYETFMQQQKEDLERASRSEREMLQNYAGQVGGDEFGDRTRESLQITEGGRYSPVTGDFEQPVQYGGDQYIVGSRMDTYGRSGGVGPGGYAGGTMGQRGFDGTISGVTGEGQLPEGLQAGLSVANQAKRQNTQIAIDAAQSKQDQIDRQARMSIQPTDLDEKARQRGLDPNNMTMEQIYDFAAQEGITLDEETANRIKAGGLAQLEVLEDATNDYKTYVDMQEKKLERDYNKALDEQERFNAQQDLAGRKLLASIGASGSFGANAALLDINRQNQSLKNDLLADYGDKKTTLSLQVNEFMRSITQQKNAIHAETTNLLEAERQKVVDTLDGLLEQGITNEQDLAKAMREVNEQYATKYVNIMTEGAKMIDEQNRFMMQYALDAAADQRAEDMHYMNTSGFVRIGGEWAKDPVTGERIPTFDQMKFLDERDRELSQQYGYIVEDGKYKEDHLGRRIPTFSREQYQQEQAFAQQKFGFEQNKFAAQENRLINQYNLDVQKFMQQTQNQGEAQRMAREKMRFDMLEAGYQPVQLPPDFGGETVTPDLTKTNYAMMQTADGGIQINIPTGAKGDALPTQRWDGRTLNQNNYQCGEFVNDVFGTGVFGDSLESKRKKIVTNIPSPGSAFVQANNQYGHVGIVENVQYDAEGNPISMDIVDANNKGNGTIDRAKVEIKYSADGTPQYYRNGVQVPIEGFTNSLSGSPVMPARVPDLGNVMVVDGQAYAAPAAALTGGLTQEQFQEKYSKEKVSPEVQSWVDLIAVGKSSIANVPGDDLRRDVANRLSVQQQEGMQYIPPNLPLNEVLQRSALGSKPNSTMLNQLGKFKSVNKQLKEISSMVGDPEMVTGPVVGRLRGLNPYDKDMKLLKQRLISVLPSMARGVFGEVGVLSEGDIKMYTQVLADPTLPKETVLEQMEFLIDLTREEYASKLEDLARGGYNVSNFAGTVDYSPRGDVGGSQQAQMDIDQLIQFLNE